MENTIKLNVNAKAVELSQLIIDDFFNKGLILSSLTKTDNRTKKHTSLYNKFFKDNNLKEQSQDFIKKYLISHNQYDLYLEYVLSIDEFFKEKEKELQKVHITLVAYVNNGVYTFKIVKSKYNVEKERIDIKTLLQVSNDKPFYKLQLTELVNIKKNDLMDVTATLHNYINRKCTENGLSIKDVQLQLARDIEYIKDLNNKNKDIVTSSTMQFFKYKTEKELEIKKEFEKRQAELKENK